MKNYLPPLASLAVTCEWLSTETGEPWTLPRLIEHYLKPWVWLDFSPDAPPEIFGDRTEGYLAPVLFTGDMNRLAIARTDAVITMTRTHDGKLFRARPGLPVSIDELRFRRDDIVRLAGKFTATPGNAWTDKARAIAESVLIRLSPTTHNI